MESTAMLCLINEVLARTRTPEADRARTGAHRRGARQIAKRVRQLTGDSLGESSHR